MSLLAGDVYLSAAGEGAPPPGWTRSSESGDALRALGVNISDADLQDLLKPEKSGFRAEIYVPDPAVHGPDAKPVLVYKGSLGRIEDPSAPDGARETGTEDFLNNAQQGTGIQSDYFDRAMRTAVSLKRELGLDFEIAGHSLGGGLASAGSAITGMPAITFNASGLHPLTVERFAKENDLPTYDTKETVTVYQTAGDVLTDVQEGAQRLAKQHRAGMGQLTNELATLLQQPTMQRMVTETLQEMLPKHAREPALDLITHLATLPGEQALRDMPLASGRPPTVLPAYSYQSRPGYEGPEELVERRPFPAPSQVAELAGPLAKIVGAAAAGMAAGRELGEYGATGGRLYGEALDRTGDIVEVGLRGSGVVIGDSVERGTLASSAVVHATGSVIAEGRELVGQVEAVSSRVQGWFTAFPAKALADGLDHVGFDGTAARLREGIGHVLTEAERGAQSATRDATQQAESIRGVSQAWSRQISREGRWVAGGLRDGFASASARVDEGYDLAGRTAQDVTSHLPALGAASWGAHAGLVQSVASHNGSPEGMLNILKTSSFARLIGPALDEATVRHGMSETVTPSLDAAVKKMEAEARELFQADPGRTGRAPSQDPVEPRQALLLNDQAHRDNPYFQQAQAGVYKLDAAYGLSPDVYSDQLAAALAAEAKHQGLESIVRVGLTSDSQRVFAADTDDFKVGTWRQAQVDVVAGRQQSIEVSTARAEASPSAAEQAAARQLAAQQGRESGAQEQDSAMRLG